MVLLLLLLVYMATHTERRTFISQATAKSHGRYITLNDSQGLNVLFEHR